MSFPAPPNLAARRVSTLRSAPADRMTAGQRGADLIGERDRQQPPLQYGPHAGRRGHQEPALEDAAPFHQQLHVGIQRESLR
jgi:hypothetical protein